MGRQSLLATVEPQAQPLIVIDPAGDILLEVSDSSPTGKSAAPCAHRYRVSSTKLRASSSYFTSLLDPSKFSEGAHVASFLAKAPPDLETELTEKELPVLYIEGVQLPSSTSSADVFRYFFQCLHGTVGPASLTRSTLNFIVGLAIVADRFLAKDCVRAEIGSVRRSHRYLRRASLGSRYTRANETAWRQRVLIGVWYEFDDWVSAYSNLLVEHGSEKWTKLETGEWEEDGSQDSSLLWMNLPGGLEEELMCRRACIFSTIASLQDHFLGKYLSGKQQCRLGYDSSPQCDVYQLGQMVRFFHRKGTMSLRSSVAGLDYKAGFGGSHFELCRSLKECPSYQVDSNHVHCGLRTLIVPRLEFLERLLAYTSQVGVCLRCWQEDKAEHSWLEQTSKEARWKYEQNMDSSYFLARESRSSCEKGHRAVRAVFVAAERDWTPE